MLKTFITKRRFGGYFTKARALTSRKFLSNPDISIPNLSDKLFFFAHTAPVLIWKSSLKISILFWEFFYLQKKLWLLSWVKRVHPLPDDI